MLKEKNVRKSITNALLASFLAINVGFVIVPSTAYAYPFEDTINSVGDTISSAVDTVKSWIWGDESSSESSSSSDSSDNFSSNDSYASEQEIAQQIADQLNATGTLPEGATIVGRMDVANTSTGQAGKKEEKRESFVAITTEVREGEVKEVTLEIDENGLVKLAESVNLRGERESNEALYQDILSHNNLSEEEADDLNKTLHKTFDKASISVAETLGISPETAAGTAAGVVASAGLLILGAGRSKEEQEEIYEEAKEDIEENTEEYEEESQASINRAKSYSSSPKDFADAESEEGKIGISASGLASESSSGLFSSNRTVFQNRGASPNLSYDFTTINSSIANMKDLSKFSDKYQTNEIKRFIQSVNPDWKGTELNKLASNIWMKAKQYNIDPLIITSQIYAESCFNPRAQSYVGATGMCQFMPETAAGYGIDPLNVEQSIDAMCQYIQKGMKDYGDYSLALAAYNAGAGYVKEYGGVPPFAETRNYVAKIQSTYASLVANVKEAAKNKYADPILE